VKCDWFAALSWIEDLTATAVLPYDVPCTTVWYIAYAGVFLMMFHVPLFDILHMPVCSFSWKTEDESLSWELYQSYILQGILEGHICRRELHPHCRI
jgi:hypothetical protein